MLPNDNREELFYRLALSFISGIGVKTGKTLIDKYGSAKQVFQTPLKELRHVDGIGEVKVKGFKDEDVLKRAEEELRFTEKEGIKILIPEDETFPKRLINCTDAPLLLFYQGNANLNAEKVVAIVGTRKNTEQGQRVCEDLVTDLQSQTNILIVSGLAYGIDVIAHKKCVTLDMPTVGVVGHGLDRMYPATHKNFAKEMMQNGGVLSEFVSGAIPEKGNFPMRNRVVAGMSDITVVVESDKGGGSLITAHMASGYNREVAAFPGRVHDSKSSGCNELIRTNVAALITGADDLLDLMNWSKGKKQKAVQKQLFLNLSPEEQKIVDVLQTKDAVHADELFHIMGQGSSQLAATLLQLEMQDIIKALPGKYYRIN